MLKRPTLRGALFFAPVVLALAGCKSSGYSSFLKFGHDDHKLALLEATQKSQKEQVEAHEHFISTLNLFNRLTRFDSEDLEGLYDDFSDAVSDCEEVAKAWQSRTMNLRMHGDTLFAQWAAQLESFSRPDMREKSAAMLEDARARHARLIVTLDGTYEKMGPVLMSLRDYVLFFEHNLNPRAINTLSDTYDGFVDEVLELAGTMETTRAETENYIDSLEGRTGMPGEEDVEEEMSDK